MLLSNVEGRTQTRRARGEGRIYHRQRSRFWWIQYYHNGRRVFESSRSTLKPVAKRLLRQRLGEVAAGIAPPPGTARLSYENLRDALVADYAASGRKWLRKKRDRNLPLSVWLENKKDHAAHMSEVSHLDNFFSGYRAMNITSDAIRAFIRKRQEEAAANGTINRSLALLRRMFRLAIEDGKLRNAPHFPMLREAPPRKGFLEHADYRKLRQELTEHLRPVLAMGYYTGMRLGEILGLRWSNMDLLSAEVRLDPGTTKNDEPRTIPLAGELLEMLKIEREKNPAGEFVFTRAGRPVGTFYKAWKSATKRAGLPELLFHDLRRTGVRNLVRAGVPERVAMAISGHKTRAVFERYNIVSGRDLKEAASKLEAYLARENDDRTATLTAPGLEPTKLTQ